MGLQLRNKIPKLWVKAKLREDRIDATHPNRVWAKDFVRDQLAKGRKLRILTIVDIQSRYAPAIDPRFSYRGEDVVQTLERVCQAVGYPETNRVAMAANLSLATLICGPISGVSCWTPPDSESPRTTPISSPSTASSEPSA